MSDPTAAALGKAEAAGAHPAELAALRSRLEQLGVEGAGLLHGDDLEPVGDVPHVDDLPRPVPAHVRDVLDRLVVVKLNGGLGTSMGLDAPKTLLEVKAGQTFLDVIARQVLHLREVHRARLPLLLLNSPMTREASLAALRRHEALAQRDLPLDVLQGKEPKLRADDLQPVEWPADPDLEWCPPGHGDLYTALAATGTLQALLDAGIRWAFVSNGDNLGALPDPRIAAWVAGERIPFLMEVLTRTPAYRKGGHLARHDGRLVLRETAQVPAGDDSFTDTERWRHFNTNNLWLDLEALAALQAEDPGAPALPLIVNRKTVDPADPASPQVLQLETAMGAAIGAIDGARALHIGVDRFAPVKTTDDLLVVRSDAFTLTEEGRMAPAFDGPPPAVALDDACYRLLPDFERRFPAGPPSLRRCRRLRVDGDVTFGRDVVVEGEVHLTGPLEIPDGEVLRG